MTAQPIRVLRGRNRQKSIFGETDLEIALVLEVRSLETDFCRLRLRGVHLGKIGYNHLELENRVPGQGASMSIVVYCPNQECLVKLTLGDDRAGDIFNCPKCEIGRIRVPVALTPPRTPAVPSLPPIPSTAHTNNTRPTRSPFPPPLPAPAPPTSPGDNGPTVLPRPLWRDPVKLSLAAASFTAFWVLIFFLCV